jgi:hypothetical protein
VTERPADAIKEYVTFAPRKEGRLKIADRLRLLSVLEDLEGAVNQGNLLGKLDELTTNALEQQSEESMRRLLLQLRLTEEAAGETDHILSGLFVEKLKDRASRLGRREWVEDLMPLQGLTVALVGGRPGTRRRCVARLEVIGARRIHQVPPHWEERVDDAAVRAKCRESDVVAVLTDETGHDATRNLRTMSELDGFTIVWTKGGPSQVIGAIVDHLARAAA